MNRYILLFCISFAVFCVLDLLWLGYLGRSIYLYYLGDFLRTPPLWSAAIIFYIFFIIGMIVFVIKPAINKKSCLYATRYGSFYGFITYMTYELTNLAVIANWPVGIVFIDILWGSILSLLISVFSTWIYLRVFNH